MFLNSSIKSDLFLSRDIGMTGWNRDVKGQSELFQKPEQKSPDPRFDSLIWNCGHSLQRKHQKGILHTVRKQDIVNRGCFLVLHYTFLYIYMRNNGNVWNVWNEYELFLYRIFNKIKALLHIGSFLHSDNI